MLKLGDSIKGEKSFGVMNYEPPYTRPAWPVLSKVEGYSGVRGCSGGYKAVTHPLDWQLGLHGLFINN
jgi:hypothetical protein